jgi:hypothetical protein
MAKFMTTSKLPVEVKSGQVRVLSPPIQPPVHTQIQPSSSDDWCHEPPQSTQDNDEKSVQPAFSLPSLKMSLSRGLRMARANQQSKGYFRRVGWNGAAQVKTGANFVTFAADVCVRSISAAGSGSALTTVVALQPNNSTIVTEASQFSVLFDTARCLGMTIHTRVTSTGMLATTSGSAAWQFGYDPANNGPFSSVVGVGETEQNTGPIALNYPSGSTSLLAENRSGYVVQKVTVPEAILPTAGSSITNENVGNGWFSTSDQNAVVGFWKGYVDPVGGLSMGADVLIYYHMEYRMRT